MSVKDGLLRYYLSGDLLFNMEFPAGMSVLLIKI